MKYYSVIKQNEFESVLMRWMSLEPIIQSEISQKEENKYLSMHIYMESRKMVLINLFAEQQWRHRHTEQIYGHSGRRGGRGKLKELKHYHI